MRFSILIATLNRADLLRKAVESILNQSFEDYEIVVVDQSYIENDDIKSLDERIRYVRIDQKGLSHARNVGIRVCRGDYICLVDDDAEYDGEFLRNANKLICQTGCTIISGCIIDTQRGTYGQRWMANGQRYVSFINSFKYCMSSAMIIERKFLQEDGFDEKFGVGGIYGSGEETDVVMRAIEKKLSVLYSPMLKVYHTVKYKGDIDEDIVYRYAVGEGAVMKKHSARTSLAILLFAKVIIKHLICIALFKNPLRKYYINVLKGEIHGFKSYGKN